MSRKANTLGQLAVRASQVHLNHQADLVKLSNVVQLAAFAAEALRVLQGIDEACATGSDLDRQLSSLVDARLQWSQLNADAPVAGVLSEILADVGRELQRIALAAEDPVMDALTAMKETGHE